MARITPTTITGGYASIDALNDNFEALADEFEKCVYRDGETDNAWTANQDANSKKLLNLPDATSNTEPLTYGQFLSLNQVPQLDAHLNDTADAHDASAISILDTANDFTATDVEGALAELQQDAETHAAAADPHTGYRLESADHTHQSAGAQAGQLDHGLALTGLSDNDHPQYLLVASLAQPATQIVYGTGAGESSDSDFTYDSATGALYVNSIDGSTSSVAVGAPGAIGIMGVNNSAALGTGGQITIRGGAGGTTAGDGGDVLVFGGDANPAVGQGGASRLIGGNGLGVVDDGGLAAIRGGFGGSAGGLARVDGGHGDIIGGPVIISGGDSTGGLNDGTVTLMSGSPGGAGGYVAIDTNTVQRLSISYLGGWALAGDEGSAGYSLTSNGTGTPPTWQATASPGGATTNIQFNDGGTFGGDADFSYDNTTGAFFVNSIDGMSSSVMSPTPGIIGIMGADASAAVYGGSPIIIRAGNGGTDFGSGGEVAIYGGHALSAGGGGGGSIDLTGGRGDNIDGGGPVHITGGQGITGGLVRIIGGDGADDGPGGDVNISAGTSSNAPGDGAVTISAGKAIGEGAYIALFTNTVERLRINEDGGWALAGDQGTAGNLLMSNGTANPPTWTSDYATAAQGTTADDAMPRAGDEFTGGISFVFGAGVFLTPSNTDQNHQGISTEGTAAEVVAVGELVYRVTATGKWAKAKADVAATSANQIAMCISAASADALVTLLLYGSLRADSLFDTFTVGAPVYISEATAGKTTSTAPSTSTNIVRKVGFAQDGNTVFFTPSNDYTVVP